MKRKMKILIVADIFLVFSAGLFGPLYAVFAEEIGGDILAAGEAAAGFGIAAGLLIFFFSRLEDHHKKSHFIIFSYLLFVIASAGYFFVYDRWSLIAVQILFGIASAINAPAWTAMYSKLLDKGHEATEWGLYEGSSEIIWAIAALIGAWIVYSFGFTALFMIMVIISTIAFITSIGLVMQVKKKLKA